MKFLREGSMSDVYYTFQDIANNPDYSDIDAIAQIKKVMSHPTDDAEQFVARKLKLMHDTIAKHPSYKNDPMGVYEEMLDMIRTEYHDETYESKEMNPTTQTFSEDNDTNSLEQWKADVRKQYPQQASQIKFKGKGFGDTIVAEIPGKDQAFGEFNMETGDAWVAPMDEGVEEGSEQEGLVSQFLKSITPKELRYYSIRDNCGPAALHMMDWAKEKGIELNRVHGYFVADNVVYDKADFTKEMKHEFLQQGLDFNDPKSRQEFIASNPKYSKEWKKVPHYWLQDDQGTVYDPTGYTQFIKTGVAKDLDKSRYETVQGMAEALDKEGDYHVSVQKGKFLPSDRGGGSDGNINYLHDLMNISGTGGGPMLVTISDPRIATEVAAMYGGKVLKTRYGTYRIVQSKGQNQKTPTPEPELVGMREDGVAEGEEQLTVQQLATISDEALDNAYHYGRSSPGNTFGWQANLKSAAYAKQMIDQGITDIEQISDAIHKGWNVTAQAFVKNPDQFDDTAKLQAAGKLEGKLQQRAQLMKQNYAQLPDEEKEKDRVVARALLQALKGQQGVAEATGDEPFDKMMTQIVKGAKPNTPKRFIKNIKKVAKIKYKFQVGDWVTIDPNEIAKWPTSGMIGRISRFSSDGDAVVNVNPGGGASGGGSSGTHTTVPTSMLEKLAVNLDEPGVAEGSHSESDEELENFLDSTKPELDRLYKLAKTSKKAKAAYYELKEKWDAANSKLYGLDEQGVAEGSVTPDVTVNKVHDDGHEKEWHIYRGKEMIGYVIKNQPDFAEGLYIAYGHGPGRAFDKEFTGLKSAVNYITSLKEGVAEATGDKPFDKMMTNIEAGATPEKFIKDIGDNEEEFIPQIYARVIPGTKSFLITKVLDTNLGLKVGDKVSYIALTSGKFKDIPKRLSYAKGVAEGSSSPDVYKDRLASIQSLRYDNPQEYAKQYRALLRDMPEEHAAHANQAQKGSYSSGQRGSGTGSTGRVSEDSAQGTANKQAWDKGHKAGYTGNEKCPCKPGSAEEKAWNAGHKVGRDERSHERHGVKEGNMKSSENNPTGPSFAGGKWKGTDSAAQAKNKYVGEISEGTMPSVKLMRNIAEGLVRVDDLVLNRPVYGKPTDQDRRAVYRMVREFADAGIDYNDAVVELVEYFKHELSELAVAPTIPAVGGKPAIVAPTGTSVGSTTPPTANTAATTPGTVSSTAPGAAPVVAPPVTQQGVDALAQMVKNAGLSPSQISTLMSKAK